MFSLFFYGTLRDPLVRERVIGRAGERSLLLRAALPHFELRRVRGTAYPMLVERSGAYVEGLVMQGLSVEEIGRLDRFEGENYARVVGEAHHEAGALAVEFYLPVRPLPADSRPWIFEEWQRKERDRHFFGRDFRLAGVRRPGEK